MTFLPNQAISALPNVLRDQTVPNTLNGIGDPVPMVRRTTRSGVSLASLGVLLVGVLVGVVAVVTRTG
jgi:hypothetical protein